MEQEHCLVVGFQGVDYIRKECRTVMSQLNQHCKGYLIGDTHIGGESTIEELIQ